MLRAWLDGADLSPVETPYSASYRKHPVCGDWVVYEPVSLLSGKKQGDFREKQREDYRKYENAPETGHLSFFRINR
jgi:hypothetical protein